MPLQMRLNRRRELSRTRQSNCMDMNEGALGDRYDSLSMDEEIALSTLREIVAKSRANGIAVDIGYLERAILAAGGSRAGRPENGSSTTFILYGVRFSIRSGDVLPGAVEVSFNPVRKW